MDLKKPSKESTFLQFYERTYHFQQSFHFETFIITLDQ